MSINIASKFRIGAAMAASNLFKVRKPITTQILVTKKCNMNCKMCFVYPVNKKEKMLNSKEPTLKELTSLIDQSCRLGAQVIVPFGGEPLIREDIKDIIHEINIRKRFSMLYTNGTFVPSRIKDILEVDQLCISVDGDEKTHDSIRGKGAYKRAIEALEAGLEHGLVCRLHTALIPDTIDSLPHMAELAKKYNVILNYGSCDATAQTKSVEDKFSLTRKQVVEFLELYAKYKREGYPISSPLRVIEECKRLMEVWPIDSGMLSKEEEEKHRLLKIPACALWFSNLYIDSDGSAYPCLPLWGKQFNPPNVYDVSVKEAWEHYADLPCHQCASIFTIEKSLFYSFNIASILDYVAGYRFLSSKK